MVSEPRNVCCLAVGGSFLVTRCILFRVGASSRHGAFSAEKSSNSRKVVVFGKWKVGLPFFLFLSLGLMLVVVVVVVVVVVLVLVLVLVVAVVVVVVVVVVLLFWSQVVKAELDVGAQVNSSGDLMPVLKTTSYLEAEDDDQSGAFKHFATFTSKTGEKNTF